MSGHELGQPPATLPERGERATAATTGRGGRGRVRAASDSRVYPLAGHGGRGLLVRAVGALPGVTDVRPTGDARGLEVFGEVDDGAVRHAVAAAGCGVRTPRIEGRAGARLRRRAGVAAAAASLLLIVPIAGAWEANTPAGRWPGWVGLGAILVLTAWAGAGLWRRAVRLLRRGRPGYECLVGLVTLTAGTDAALRLSNPTMLPPAYAGGFLAFPLLAIALALAGQLLQVRAMGPAQRAIAGLRALRPLRVTRLTPDGGTLRVPTVLVSPGDRLRVDEGEPVPADGRVLEGSALVDESLLTGDTTPVERGPGAEVIGGSVSHGEAFTLEVGRTGRDTALARLIGAVRNARRNKPAIDRVVDSASAWAMAAAVLAAVTAGGLVWAQDGSAGVIAAVVLGTLLLACPPALGLTTPLSVSVGVARAAEHGAVARRGDALPAAHRLTTVVLDKVVAVAPGTPEVVAVEPCGRLPVRELFRLAASLDAGGGESRYPAIVAAAGERDIALSRVVARRLLPDGGLVGQIGDREVILGTAECLDARGIGNPLRVRGAELQDDGSTPLYVAVDGSVAGLIALAEVPRAEAAEAVARLRALGLDVVMLTGDDERTGRAVARALGIDRVFKGVLPEDKAARVRELQSRGERVAMVGHGTNDAPALSQADVGFAVASGTEVAVRSADVAVVRDSLHAVVDALALARATVANIRQNMAIALCFNATLMPVAAGVFLAPLDWLLTPGLLIAATALGTAGVLANAARLRHLEMPG